MKLTINLLVLFFLTTQTTAQLTGSLNFNGRDNFVEIKDSPLNTIGTENFTFEVWIQGNEANQNNHPVIFSNRGTNAFGGGIMFFLHDRWNGSRFKMLCFQVNAINYLFIDNGSFNGSLLDGQCHHVAISRNGNNISFYIDGNKIGDKVIPNSSTISLNNPLWIGKDKSVNNTFNGLISQGRIWNTARTQNQIEDNKDLRLLGNEYGLIAYWEMNNDNNQIVTDKTGQFNGTLGRSSERDNQDPSWSDDGCVEESAISSGEVIPNCFFQISPNPTSGLITIQQEYLPNSTFKIIDSKGQLVTTITLDESTFDLSHYPSGVYFLQLAFRDCMICKRIIKF